MKSSIHTQTAGYILAAFGFVAGLAWNEAIKALIDKAFPLSTDGLAAKFIYAVVATLLVAIASAFLLRGKEKE